MTQTLPGRLAQIFAELEDQPFGNTRSISGHTLQPFSRAGQQAASNLLAKANRALDVGDHDRAQALVERAARLPFDRHERTAPVAWEIHMQLFCLVTDELEQSELHDVQWLDAALEVMSTAGESARCTMRDVLRAIDNDYQLVRSERARLRAALSRIPERPELRDQQLEPAQLSAEVMAILLMCRAYRAAIGLRAAGS